MWPKNVDCLRRISLSNLRLNKQYSKTINDIESTGEMGTGKAWKHTMKGQRLNLHGETEKISFFFLVRSHTPSRCSPEISKDGDKL